MHVCVRMCEFAYVFMLVCNHAVCMEVYFKLLDMQHTVCMYVVCMYECMYVCINSNG